MMKSVKLGFKKHDNDLESGHFNFSDYCKMHTQVIRRHKEFH